MSTELTEIDGIGPSYAEELDENGYESAEDVADADADELDDILDTHDGADLKESATDVAGETDASDVEQREAVPVDTYELDIELSVDQRNHLIKGFVNEELRARKTNTKGGVDEAQDAIDAIITGPPYEFTRQQLDAGYRAVSQLESEYRSERGIGSFVTQIRNLKDAFQTARKDAQQDQSED